MTKIKVELEFDLDAWNGAHGPGSEWFAKYGPGQERTREQLVEALKEVIDEGFYDWSSHLDGEPDRQWLKFKIT